MFSGFVPGGVRTALDAGLTQRGTSPQVSRGVALASTAIAIAMGATAMADIEVLGQLAPVLGAAPSDSTVRRTLNLADDRTVTRIAQARARIRKHVWKQADDAAGFPLLSVAGKELAGWTVIDMDATLVTAHSSATRREPLPPGRKATVPPARSVVHEHARVPGHEA